MSDNNITNYRVSVGFSVFTMKLQLHQNPITSDFVFEINPIHPLKRNRSSCPTLRRLTKASPMELGRYEVRRTTITVRLMSWQLLSLLLGKIFLSAISNKGQWNIFGLQHFLHKQTRHNNNNEDNLQVSKLWNSLCFLPKKM